MAFWKKRDPQCVQRVAALKASLVDSRTASRPKTTTWKIWLLSGVVLMALNPFAVAYFLVTDVAGLIPKGPVQVYARLDRWERSMRTIFPNSQWYAYTDILNHDHSGWGRPNVFPGATFQDMNAQQVTIHGSGGNGQIAQSPQPTAGQASPAPAPHQKPKLTLDDWRKFSRALDPHLKTTALLCIMLFLVARLMRRRYIFKNDFGLAISDSPDSPIQNTTFLPWQCIKRIRMGEFKSSFLLIETDHGSHEYLRWHDIITCMEPGEFINTLRTFAPHAVHGCKFPTENASLNKVDEHTYTKLWFKYYSKGTERQRPGQLTAEEELQDGRFKIVERLGSGGQGTAYLALDQSGLPPAATEEQAGSLRSQCEEVVLKEYILPVHRGQQVVEQSAKRLRLEADILQKIDHPNIVKLLDEFTEDHRGYLVMEYVRGTQLKALVAQEGAQTEATVRELALQICDILEYLHGLDPPIIHRDLTPDNLILQNDGIVKLVDFNVAHQLESAATATVVGKHAYIPPEQFRGKPTPQSDIYALGCTLHFLLTGQEPEPLTVSRPRLLNENVSEDLNQIIATCTNLDPSKRFASIAEIREYLANSESHATIKIARKVEA